MTVLRMCVWPDWPAARPSQNRSGRRDAPASHEPRRAERGTCDVREDAAAHLSLTLSIFFPAGPLESLSGQILRQLREESSEFAKQPEDRDPLLRSELLDMLSVVAGGGGISSWWRPLRGPLYRPEKAAAEASFSIERHPLHPAYVDLDVVLLRSATSSSGCRRPRCRRCRRRRRARRTPDLPRPGRRRRHRAR